MTTRQVAESAGVSQDDVERLVDLGVLGGQGGGTLPEGAVALVRFALALEKGGIPLEVVGGAVGEGRLSIEFAPLVLDDTRSRVEPPSLRERCENLGLDPTFVCSLFEAAGLARPEPDDPMRADDGDVLSIVSLLVTAARGRSDQVLRVARVIGEHVRWIAEAEADLYREIARALPDRGDAPGGNLREAISAASPMLRSLSEQMLLWLYRRHDEHTMLERLIEQVEAAVGEGDRARERRTDDQAVAFVDLAGYTTLAEERGDAAAVQVARDLAGLVDETARAHRGRSVKWLGDGVMVHFRHPADAVDAALELVARIPATDLPPAHVGVAAGPVVLRDGDVYGRTVNLAARLSGHAGPGEVVVDDSCAGLAGGDRVAFERLGEVTPKGFLRPVTVHRAVGRAPAPGD